MLFSISKTEWLSNLRSDFFAGLVTAIALIPEVIGFAIIAGINPINALYAAIIMSFVTSFIGGRPAMTSAAAGSMALVLVTIIKYYGLEYMLAATVLTGFIQLFLGYLGIHKVVKYVSKPIMMGFVNSLAILILLAQLQQLPHQNIATYIMVITTIILMYILPKITKVIPPALIVIVLMTAVTALLPIQLQTVGDLGNLSTSFPHPGLPNIPWSFHSLKIIFPVAVALAIVGLTESLLTLPLIDQLTQTKGNSQREAKAQGLANIVTGFLGGQAGCAMIGQAVINVKSGGRQRFSTLTASVTLLVMIVFLKGLMAQIPTGALIGIMITVAFTTFDWASLKLIKMQKLTISEVMVMLVTIIIVVITHNLAIGIVFGIILSWFISLISKLLFQKLNN
ncbi:SulP family inorganic anion transporter [Periweissella fabalis]|uniref:SulP family inorganic anion transporter n=1 Tax=Periweissella fabalis TaxID=1070421 RepID=A0A7X6S3F6_9LACO|nr:SulP family inorganic anion transporter [Periweissella fabalis]MCM0598562.1 SulP family inorganic anion transporter [Periweissella fabalis]NKZ24156.1 SulP family inorganic anion transporter [Periweissella fabalis]